MKKQLVIIALFTLLNACSGDSVSTKNFSDFQQQVIESAENDAIDCGVVTIDASEIETNSCIGETFTNQQPFFAIYQLQGIDSEVAAAITGTSDSRVYYWTFDSNPAGGTPTSDSIVRSNECINPSLSGTVDTGYADLFVCD